MSAAIVDKIGRRSLTITGNLLLSISIIGIAFSFAYNSHEAVQIALLCAIMFTFSLGPGPFTLVVVNEMLPLQLRARVVSAAILLNRIGSGTVAFTFLSLSQNVFCPGGEVCCAAGDTNTTTAADYGMESYWQQGGDRFGLQYGFDLHAANASCSVAPGSNGATAQQVGTARAFYLYVFSFHCVVLILQ